MMSEPICNRCVHHDICDAYTGEDTITFFPYNEDCTYFDDVRNYQRSCNKLRCEVKDCINNVNGYCDTDSYVTIQEDGTCDSMLIRSGDKEDE